MMERAEPSRVEPRWPVALAIFTVLFLLAVLPERVRLFPVWFTHGIGMAVFVSIAVVGLTAKPRWLRVERTAVLLFFVIKGAANLASLAYLIDLIMRGSTEVGGLKASRVKHCGVAQQRPRVLVAVLADRSGWPGSPDGARSLETGLALPARGRPR
jgi:hypothetical protein